MAAEPKTNRTNRAAKNRIWDEMPIRSLIYERDEDGYAVSGPDPVDEDEPERRLMTATFVSLKLWYAGRDVYVSGLKYVHYTKDCDYVSPDCYVMFGVKAEQLDSDKNPFNSEHCPAIVFEFAQKEMGREGKNENFKVYERKLKIPEYILYEPDSDNLTRILQGYRLNTAGKYAPIPLVDGRMFSEALSMFMEIRDGEIRFTDAKTGEYLRTPQESEAQRIIAERRADRAEAEIALLRAELEALRNQNQNEQGQ